ncbi:hypothetical protein AB1Y20_007951 [Prymnesium parvum]|uniref:Chromo domain-containing protein n=1 Tax=Prymnesium parvum TaxID=97485 RepID=A0AB34ITD9_PRYPA
MYEPEKVVAQRLAKGVSQFLVKWVGYESKDNTWEPIENLAGCEDIIADFKEREKTRQLLSNLQKNDSRLRLQGMEARLLRGKATKKTSKVEQYGLLLV